MALFFCRAKNTTLIMREREQLIRIVEVVIIVSLCLACIFLF